MVLLTSGQVSMAVSSGVVFIFTFALFLTGYILQQQTVKTLHAAVKPRHAVIRSSFKAGQSPDSRPIEQAVLPSELREEVLGEDYLGRLSESGDWASYAEGHAGAKDEGDGTALVDDL